MDDLLSTNCLFTNKKEKINKPIFDDTIKEIEEDYYKKYKISQISIDSGDRDTLLYPMANNFEIDLNNNYTNVEQIQLKQIQIENMFQPVNENNNKIRWRYVKSSDYTILNCNYNYPSGITEEENHVVEITPGNYTIQTLVNAIRNTMNQELHTKNYPLDISFTITLKDTPLNDIDYKFYNIGFKYCVHTFSIYINPISYKTTFINRLENLKIYCIQTILNPEDDKLGEFFGQTFLKGDKTKKSIVTGDECKKSIYIYIESNQIFNMLSLNYGINESVTDSIWEAIGPNNYKKLIDYFKLPIIPSNIPSIGGIDKDLINNKEYYLVPPTIVPPTTVISIDTFTPVANYNGPIIQPIDVIRYGYRNLTTPPPPNGLFFNTNTTIGNVPSNLLRLRLEIRDNSNNPVYPKFNQTYFLDKTTANFYMNYDNVHNITNLNGDKFEIQLPTITGPILNCSLLEDNEDDKLPVVGRGVPFEFVLDDKDDVNTDSTTNSLLLSLGWDKGCDDTIVVSDKCPVRTIHTNMDFNIYNKIDYYVSNISYSPPKFPKVKFLYQNIGNDTFIISSQQYLFLRILFPSNDKFDSLIIGNNLNKDVIYTTEIDDTKYTNSILAKIMLSNIPGNISNFNDNSDTNFIVLNNAIFENVLVENINKIRIQLLNENGNIINITNNFNLTLQIIENLTTLENSNINSKTNQTITTLKHIINNNVI